MKSIQSYIYTLLFDYEYVTIPGFGSFISHYIPAVVKENGTLSPSSKRIAFNALLKLDDGILITAIARKELIQNEEAAKKVKNFVEQNLQRLENKEQIIFAGIGSFVLNSDNKVEFQPQINTNFLGDSFGFDDIVIKPLKENQEEIIFEEATEDFKLVLEEQRKNKNVLVYSLLALPFLLVALFYVSNQPKSSSEQASINPIDAIEAFRKATKPEKILVVPAESPKTTIPEPIKETIKIVEKRFYVVTGCFKGNKNANKQLQSLKENGFKDAYLLMPSRKGKYIKVVATELIEEKEVEEISTNLKNIVGENPVVLKK